MGRWLWLLAASVGGCVRSRTKAAQQSRKHEHPTPVHPTTASSRGDCIPDGISPPHDAAAGYRTARLSTFADPRRDAHEFYSLGLAGLETATLWVAQSWSRDLDSSGTTMEHHITRVAAITVTEPA